MKTLIILLALTFSINSHAEFFSKLLGRKPKADGIKLGDVASGATKIDNKIHAPSDIRGLYEKKADEMFNTVNLETKEVPKNLTTTAVKTEFEGGKSFQIDIVPRVKEEPGYTHKQIMMHVIIKTSDKKLKRKMDEFFLAHERDGYGNPGEVVANRGDKIDLYVHIRNNQEVHPNGDLNLGNILGSYYKEFLESAAPASSKIQAITRRSSAVAK